MPNGNTQPTLKLYSGPLSLFTGKVRIALAEKNLDYERIEVPFDRANGYEPKHPEVIRHNPKAQVPVLVDGRGSDDPAQNVILWDSTVIIEYLDEAYPDPPLLPRDVADRARCRMLELHADEVFFAKVWTLIQHVFYADPNEDAAQDIDNARHALAGDYADLNASLEAAAANGSSPHPYLAGDRFTIVDIAYRLATLFASTLGGAPDPSLQAFQAWLARVDARPSVAKELEGIADSMQRILAPN